MAPARRRRPRLPVRSALATVHAAYRLDGTTEEWLDGLLAACAGALDRGKGCMAHVFRVRGDGRVHLLPSRSRRGPISDGLEATALEASAAMTPHEVAESLCNPVALESASEALVRSDVEPRADVYFAPFAPYGVVDCLAAKAADVTGEGVMVTAPSPTRVRVDPSEAARWTAVMAHVLSGLRLRRALAADGEVGAEAVLDPAGRVLHADTPEARRATARARLRDAAVRIDAARSRRGREDPDAALQAWQALIQGRWSLVDRFDRDGRRYLVARRNDPVLPAPDALSLRERQVAAYASLGHSNKYIAYALGLSASTVSSHLCAAMRRLGARHRADLAALLYDPPG